RDAALLKQSVNNPGSLEVPEIRPVTAPTPVLEILPRDLTPDPGEAGMPLPVDPALMTVTLSRPGPQTWLRLYPERPLRTVLRASKRTRDSSPEYHYVAPALEGMVKKHLRVVNVHLVAEVAGDGEPFLWIVPESDFSPYHNGMAKVLALGTAFIRQHLFV